MSELKGRLTSRWKPSEDEHFRTSNHVKLVPHLDLKVQGEGLEPSYGNFGLEEFSHYQTMARQKSSWGINIPISFSSHHKPTLHPIDLTYSEIDSFLGTEQGRKGWRVDLRVSRTSGAVVFYSLRITQEYLRSHQLAHIYK